MKPIAHGPSLDSDIQEIGQKRASLEELFRAMAIRGNTLGIV